MLESKVRAVRSAFIPMAPGDVGDFLADVENLPKFEPKLRRVHVIEARGRSKRMRAESRIGPFRFTFEIDFVCGKRGGFMSKRCSLGIVRFGGGFAVRS